MLENLDAELFAAIDECKAALAEIGRLDDDDPGAAAIRQERKIARMPAMTVEGYHAKIDTIRKSEFDDDIAG